MLSTVSLFVLTSLDQLLLIMKMLFTYFTKQATLMNRSTVLIPPLSKYSTEWEPISILKTLPGAPERIWRSTVVYLLPFIVRVSCRQCYLIISLSQKLQVFSLLRLFCLVLYFRVRQVMYP